MKYMVELVPEEEGGFSVHCPELDVYSQGETEEEALANIQEAVELHLESLRARGKRIGPRRIIRAEIEIAADVG